MASRSIGGTTLHAFAGIGLGSASVDVCVAMIKKNEMTFNRWTSAKILIIDEISMIEAAFFDKLNEIAKRIRKKSDLAFGGLQIVLCGDFMQLPPRK